MQTRAGCGPSSSTDRCPEDDCEQTGPLPSGLKEGPLSALCWVCWRERRLESGKPAREGEGQDSGDSGNGEKRLE